MVQITSSTDALESVRTLRQVRQYEEGSVSADALNSILEIARWSGSSRNTQPWHFIVIDDKQMLKDLSDLRENITWVAEGALAIAIALPGENPPHEMYDMGRVTERMMIAAQFHGLGSGTAWFGEPEREAKAKMLLGVPDNMTCPSIVVIGPYTTYKDPRPAGPKPGRKPLDEVVSYGTYGEKR